MSAPQPEAPPRMPHEHPFRVLRYRDFRLIWSAEILSQTGTQIQRVAVAWQVFELTGDPLQLGLLGLDRFVPLFLFGLAGGVVADRYDRRKTLILSQLALMAVAAVLTALVVARRVPGIARFRWESGIPEPEVTNTEKSETHGAKCIDERASTPI